MTFGTIMDSGQTGLLHKITGTILVMQTPNSKVY